MKRKDLVQELIQAGYEPTGGGKHEIFKHPDGRFASVPRHNEIPKGTALRILRQSGLR